MKKITVLIPLPQTDFDPSEVSISWFILKQNNIQVVFATPNAEVASADNRMLTGAGLGILSGLLKADKNAISAHSQMIKSEEYLKPTAWSQINSNDYDGLILPGGHAQGMKPYLESKILQNCTSEFFASQKIIGAICHGVIIAARSKNSSGKSNLFGKKTTALLKSQELTAWFLTYSWLGNYYRTYPETVQDEVIRNIKSSKDFITGPIPLLRDSPQKLEHGFVVIDENYVSARWPGDVHHFATQFVKKVQLRKNLQI